MPQYPSSPKLSRRKFLIAGAAVGAAGPLLVRTPGAWSLGGPQNSGPKNTGKAFGFPSADQSSEIVRPMVFPVEGKVTWTDTFGDPRGGGTRIHEGQDLMGEKLQKLLACVDGTVVALRYGADGNSLYLEDEDGWYYAYLHINNDTPDTDDGKNPLDWAFAKGLKEGDKVKKGQHVAYLGDSGNAEESGAHCHFEIRKPSSKGVWKAQAINAAPSLEAAAQVAARPAVELTKTGSFVPFTSAAALITQQYLDFLGREPSKATVDLYSASLDAELRTPAWLIRTVLDSAENQDSAGAVTRLYHGFFGRDPDLSGFNHWVTALRGDTKLPDVAAGLAKSGEFSRTYGSLSNREFVKTVYANVLDRPADKDGLKFWVGELDNEKTTRGRVMLKFTESTENKARLANRVKLFLVNAQMLATAPAVELMDLGEMQLRRGTVTFDELVESIRLGDTYATRLANG